jgi:mevalonate kinase
VIGFTGSKGLTGPLVAKVKRYADHSGFAREVIQEIGALTLEGMDYLKKDDRSSLGKVMTKNHKLLAILGVSTPELDRLVQAALPHSYGAKLTGAGGGGSMIALTDQPKEVCEAIKKRGGIPYSVRTGVEGARIEK